MITSYIFQTVACRITPIWAHSIQRATANICGHHFLSDFSS